MLLFKLCKRKCNFFYKFKIMFILKKNVIKLDYPKHFFTNQFSLFLVLKWPKIDKCNKSASKNYFLLIIFEANKSN